MTYWLKLKIDKRPFAEFAEYEDRAEQQNDDTATVGLAPTQHNKGIILPMFEDLNDQEDTRYRQYTERDFQMCHAELEIRDHRVKHIHGLTKRR